MVLPGIFPLHMKHFFLVDSYNISDRQPYSLLMASLFAGLLDGDSTIMLQELFFSNPTYI